MTVLLLEGTEASFSLDSLPYIDPLSDEAKRLAEKLIDDECATMRAEGRTPEQYIAHLPPLSAFLKFKDSSIMQNELKRIESGESKMPPMDETRLSIEPPRLHDQQDPQAWKASANNAAAQLEHQYHRIENLKLGVKFGPFVWKAHNARTDVYMKVVEKRRRDVDSEITKVNQRRKLQQEQAQVTLSRLSERYQELVQKNVEIQVACEKLKLKLSNHPKETSEEPTDLEGEPEKAEMDE